MGKKVTVKDVAREAGVSVATVSYIMNNRTDQKISDATRKKVLQIANLLNYTPNSVAKSLATGRNSIIGISYSMDDATPSRNLELSSFINMLIERLNRLKYDVIYMPVNTTSDSASINRNIDGIIAIDLSNEDFVKLADNCFVPVISVDMIINDSLFYQIYSDIPQLAEKASEYLGDDYYFVLERYKNEEYLTFLTETLPQERILLYTPELMADLTKLKGKKALVLGSYLALILRSYIHDYDMVAITSHESEVLLPDSIHVLKNDISKKANLAINILLNAMDRKFDVKHDHKISMTDIN
ncbi:MAG: LacI family DNA-binding transcriptional regulator [Lachnospiraceae bacterium]|nr:LacI family DNA-binding transcriptional regulator [Lachnospiraceae bacterium]MEE1255485.1 LacI family DNA-binding transcriptional regulator [Lachnospiraceae bacterium]